MKIYLGTDHAGFELKGKLKVYLKELGYLVADKGAFELNTSDDYPDFVRPVAEAVASDAGTYGLVLGKSGQGEAMCANRVVGVRCAVYYGGPLELLKLERQHNNANILSLGAEFLTDEGAKLAVKTFFETEFSGAERHIRRLGKLDNQ